LAKKRKVIKRLYESGRETTLAPARKKPASSKQKERTSKKEKQQPVQVTPPKAFDFRPQATGTKVAKKVTPKKETNPQKVTFPQESYQLPPNYNGTRITLMVKDPFWIYAYWEISVLSLEELKSRLSEDERNNAQLVVRLYDVTLRDFNGYNANSFFDIEVGYEANNWYINLWTDYISYIAEIGLRIHGGKFFPLARSNQVHTPRMSYSPRTEAVWMKVTDEERSAPFVVSRPASARRDIRGRPSQPAEPKKKRVYYLSEQDLRLYYSKLSPLLRDIISARLSERPTGESGLPRYSFVLEGDSDEERTLLLSRLPESFFIKRITTGASESLVILDHRKHVAGSLFASESLAKPKGRNFFFELNTELIVYGRTEPDARVWLGNKKIALNPDGTFAMRFALPDGKIPLEFKAESADKEETRNIDTYVERNTHYPE
jgi:hypothetical protein